MKKIKLLITLFLFANSLIFAQLIEKNPLAAYKIGKEWVIIDEFGKKIYSSKRILDVEQYSENLLGTYIFENKNVISAYFDNSGKIAVTSYSRKPYPFQNGRAFVIEVIDEQKNEYLFGCVDKTGKVVIPMKYIDMLAYSEELAYVMNLDERGYVDTNGNFVMKFEKGFVGYGFREGFSPISDANKGKFGFIDKTGKVVIDYLFDEVRHFSEGLASALQKNYTGDAYFGFINKNGNFVINNVYEETSNFSEGLAFVAVLDVFGKNFLWSVINKDGVGISDFKFLDFKDFSEGIATVMNDKNLWQYIDKSANYVDDNTYKYCGSFKNGKAFVVTENDKKIFIDKTGKQLFEIPKNATVVLDCRTNERFETKK